jgi:hypothetical protein
LLDAWEAEKPPVATGGKIRVRNPGGANTGLKVAMASTDYVVESQT